MQPDSVVRLEPHVTPGEADLIRRSQVLAHRLEKQAGAAGKQQREQQGERAASHGSFRQKWQDSSVAHPP